MVLLAFLNDNFSKPDHSIWKGMWWDVVYTIIPDYRGEIIIPKIKKGAESQECCRVNCTQILIERKTPQRSLKAPQCVNPELRVVQSNPALAAGRLESLFTTEAQAQATPATEETQVEKRHQNNWQSGFYVSSSVGKMSTKAEQCEYDCVCVCVFQCQSLVLGSVWKLENVAFAWIKRSGCWGGSCPWWWNRVGAAAGCNTSPLCLTAEATGKPPTTYLCPSAGSGKSDETALADSRHVYGCYEYLFLWIDWRGRVCYVSRSSRLILL